MSNFFLIFFFLFFNTISVFHSLRFNFFIRVAADSSSSRKETEKKVKELQENSLQFLSLRHFNYWRGAKPGTISGKIYRDKKPKTSHSEQRE